MEQYQAQLVSARRTALAPGLAGPPSPTLVMAGGALATTFLESGLAAGGAWAGGWRGSRQGGRDEAKGPERSWMK